MEVLQLEGLARFPERYPRNPFEREFRTAILVELWEFVREEQGIHLWLDQEPMTVIADVLWLGTYLPRPDLVSPDYLRWVIAEMLDRCASRAVEGSTVSRVEAMLEIALLEAMTLCSRSVPTFYSSKGKRANR